MRRSIVISVVMVLCVLGLLLFGFGTETEEAAAPPGPVVLLVEDDTGAFLLQVKQGAQQAAEQAGCTLSQEPLSGEMLSETAQRWAQRKATAALLLTEDAVLRKEAEAALKAAGVPVVVLRDTETRASYAAMDERQAGMLLGDFAKTYARVYLVGDAPLRLEGALSALRPEQAVIDENALPSPGEEACVVALTGKETRRLAAMREAGELTATLVGIDPGEERVRLMAEGAVDAIAVETPYAMGYLAMQMALSGKTEPCLLPYKLVVPSEMYEAKNVKLMFPLLH